MKISRDNYELYFINYFDSMLKPEEIDELMLFLKNNPDLEDEFLSFESIGIASKEEVLFDNKNMLKKSVSDKRTINDKNIDEFLIAYIEKDLSYNDMERVESFIEQNPTYQKDLNAYKKTVLVPDLNVTFGHKKSLKKKVAVKEFKIKYFYYTVASAAAVVLLMVNIFFSDVSPLNNKGQRLASKDTFLEAGMSHGFFSDPDQISDENNPDEYNNTNNYRHNNENNSVKAQSFDKLSQKNTGLLLAANNTPSVIIDLRDEYTSIYDYIQYSENNKSTENDYSDVIPDKPKDSFLKYAANKIFSGKADDKTPENSTNKVDIWKIVDIGTYGINSLVNNDLIDINRKKENNTVKTDFAFGGNVVYSRTSTVK